MNFDDTFASKKAALVCSLPFQCTLQQCKNDYYQTRKNANYFDVSEIVWTKKSELSYAFYFRTEIT